jgi:cytochrome b561
MTWKNTEARYSTLSIALHWFMLGLLAVVYACIELRGNLPKGSGGRALIVEAHYVLGLTVFALVWIRLLARTLGVTPRIQPKPPGWQTGLAHLMHVLLYALMIALPILGWLTLNASGKPAPFYGLELPHLIGPDKELANQIKHWHERIGGWGYWLIGLHAAAGLYHHYVVRDNTLVRMLPWHSKH